MGFQRSESNDTLYFRMKNKHMVILVLYVDDLIITGNNEAHIKQVKEELKAGFKMTDLGTLHYYLGVEISQHPNQIFLSQTKYATEFLNTFGMEYCKPSLTPMEHKLKLSKFEGGDLVNNTKYMQLVGSLIYLTNTQPDLSYSINIFSRFMQEPRESHWNSTKRVLRYIQGTKDFGLLYKRNTNFTLVGYSDVDFVGDIDNITSTSSYLMNMGSITISWNCKKHTTIANYLAEAEYISSWEATCEIVWLRIIL
jgi:hypothetical protein